MPANRDQLARDVVATVTTMTRLAPMEAIRQMLVENPTPELRAFVAFWEALNAIPRPDGEDVVIVGGE